MLAQKSETKVGSNNILGLIPFRSRNRKRLAGYLFTVLMTGMILLCPFQNSWAQSGRSDVLDELIVHIDSALSQKAGYVRMADEKAEIQDLDSLFNHRNFATGDKYASANMLENKRQRIRDDWGVNLQAGYLQNFDQGVFDSEGIFYNRRYQLGVKWDVLSNGWQENQLRAKQLQREIKIEQFEQREANREQHYQVLREQLLSLVRQEQKKIKKRYKELLTIKKNELKTLYDLGYKSWDEVLEISSKLSETDMVLNTDVKLDSLDGKWRVHKNEVLPILSVDYEKLREEVAQKPIREKTDSLRLKNTADEYRRWRDISLSANVNYNYYDRSGQQLPLTNAQDREYFSFAVNLSVPLTVFKEGNEEFKEAQRQEIAYKNKRQDFAEHNMLRQHFREYQELKNQYANTYYTYQRQLQRIEQKQTEQQNGKQEYDSSELLNLYLSQVEAIWQLTKTKEKIYEKLIRLSRFAPYYPLSSYASVWTPPKLAQNSSSSSTVYMWSGTFESYKNPLLLDYMSARNFDTILLSPGPDMISVSDKLSSFIRSAKTIGVSVDLMKGSNVLIKEKNWDSIHDFAKNAQAFNAKGIHLDVEPHTLDDWTEKREYYLEQYTRMVTYAKRVTERYGLSLSISVPVFYDDILPELYPLVDKLYVMAYNISTIPQLKKRLSKELQFTGEHGNDREKLVVALRPDDFVSQTQMEDFIAQLNQQYGKLSFAVHDFETLIGLN
jgi:hypothetical protein